MAETMTPTTFASRVDSDGRTVRKFLRSITPKDEQPGKGSRWVMPTTKRELTKLEKQFAAWTEANAKPEPEVETETVEDDTELEPTDDELTDEVELDD